MNAPILVDGDGMRFSGISAFCIVHLSAYTGQLGFRNALLHSSILLLLQLGSPFLIIVDGDGVVNLGGVCCTLPNFHEFAALSSVRAVSIVVIFMRFFTLLRGSPRVLGKAELLATLLSGGFQRKVEGSLISGARYKRIVHLFSANTPFFATGNHVYGCNFQMTDEEALPFIYDLLKQEGFKFMSFSARFTLKN